VPTGSKDDLSIPADQVAPPARTKAADRMVESPI
jgi:hypothetical protein